MNDRQWGWRVVMNHHASAEPLPPSLRDPHICHAYRYLEGNRNDPMAKAHALKVSPDCMNIRKGFQSLLCARDISMEGVALQRQQLMRAQDAQTKKKD